MTTQPLTVLLTPYGTASLNLPTVLAPDTFARLQAAIDRVLDDPPPDMGKDDAGDAGSIEVDSWSVHSQ